MQHPKKFLEKMKKRYASKIQPFNMWIKIWNTDALVDIWGEHWIHKNVELILNNYENYGKEQNVNVVNIDNVKII